MRVAISNGHEEADYIIKMYKNHKNKIVVINDDLNISNELSKKNSRLSFLIMYLLGLEE